MVTLLWQLRFGFTFGLCDRWRPQLTAILDGCKIGRVKIWLQNPNQYRELCEIQIFCDDNFIDKVTFCHFENSQSFAQDKLLPSKVMTSCSHSNFHRVFVFMKVASQNQECTLPQLVRKCNTQMGIIKWE